MGNVQIEFNKDKGAKEFSYLIKLIELVDYGFRQTGKKVIKESGVFLKRKNKGGGASTKKDGRRGCRQR